MIPKHPTVGIIGGKGKTGSQFARLFRAQGCKVTVTGAETRHRNAALIQSSDIILFALPLSRAAELIRNELRSSTRKDQLVLDVSSLKMNETKAMATAKGEVVGMHPLFGPATDPKGERIILCPVRVSDSTLSSLKGLLKKMGLKSTVMSPKEHDHLMGTIQVIPHLKSLLMAEVLRGRKVKLKNILKNCTPTYEMEFNVIGRFLDDHPDLYMPIIFRNPETKSILRDLRSTIDAYIQIADSSDLATAEKRYKECQKLFAPHLKRARRHSEACIRTLLSLTR